MQEREAGGEAHGEARGEARGRLASAREALGTVLEARGFELDAGTEELITRCDDPETLRCWTARAATAGRAEQVFAPIP